MQVCKRDFRTNMVMMMVIHKDIKMDIIGLRNLQKAVKSLDG